MFVLHCMSLLLVSVVFFFNDTATTEIYTLSLHDALPICAAPNCRRSRTPHGALIVSWLRHRACCWPRSEEHTSELQSQSNLVCRLLLEKKKSTTATSAVIVDASHDNLQ